MLNDTELSSNPVIDLAGYRETSDKVSDNLDNIVSFEDSIARFRKFERKQHRSMIMKGEAPVINLASRRNRLSALGGLYV